MFETMKNRKINLCVQGNHGDRPGRQPAPSLSACFLHAVRLLKISDCETIAKCLCSQTCTTKKYSRSREGFWKGRGSKASYWSNLRPCAFCMHYRRQNHCNSLMNGQCGARQKRENANICVQGAALEGRPARPRQTVKTSIFRLLCVFRTFFGSKW